MEESAFFNKLRSAGNAAITILAPSDEAFQKIPASRLDAIMKDKEARLGNGRISSLCPDLHASTSPSYNRYFKSFFKDRIL
jgi:hypothetical protein